MAVVCSILVLINSAFAQGTAFTYQGRLNDGVNPASGVYDVRFALFDNVSAGSQIGPTRTNLSLAVSNGLFIVTLDFTNGAFPGADRWLEMGVRSNGVAVFTALTPRQRITPAPYAITASNLTGVVPFGQITGTLPTAQLSGTYGSALTLNNAANSFTGNGSSLSNLNAANLSSGTLSDARLSANVALRAGGNTFSGNQIVTSGNVGIGTNAPGTSLEVNGGIRARGGPPGGFGNNNNGYAFNGNNGDTDSGMFSSADGQLEFYVNATERMRIDQFGRVGIGTNAPSADVHVSTGGDNTSPQAWINQENVSDYARLRFTLGGDVNNRWDFGARSNVFVLYSGQFDAEMLHLDSNGLQSSKPINAANGLIIETRTNNPPSPVTGQIWLRTDLP